jgi:hypothetical protein
MEAVSQRHAAPQPSTAAAKRCVCIINPAGANGKLGRLWTKLSADVREQLKGFNLQECLTTGPGTASSLARKAAAAGADVVLAVGGDGTIHEVRRCAQDSAQGAETSSILACMLQSSQHCSHSAACPSAQRHDTSPTRLPTTFRTHCVPAAGHSLCRHMQAAPNDDCSSLLQGGLSIMPNTAVLLRVLCVRRWCQGSCNSSSSSSLGSSSGR